MVETKTLTLKYVAPPVGLPEFRFSAYGPPENMLDSREIFPVGVPWPSVTKTYEEGDPVNIQFCVKNVGDGAGTWTVTVTDLDTLEIVKTWSDDLDPKYRFKTTVGVGASLGPMPARNWRLSFKVTP